MTGKQSRGKDTTSHQTCTDFGICNVRASLRPVAWKRKRREDVSFMSSSEFHPINTDRAQSPDASTECHESDSLDKLRWWQKATIYQVLIQSFQDTDGDGKGDLRGIVNRLDYFVALGIDVIWISPIYESPMRDMG